MTLACHTQSVDENELLRSIQLAQDRLKELRKKKELRKNNEHDVIQLVVDTLSNLIPGTNLPSTDSSLAKLKLLCTVVDDQVQSLEDVSQATAKKNHEKELNVALVKKIEEDRTKMIHQKDDISLAMAEGQMLLSKICQPDLFYNDALKKKGQLQLELKQYVETFKVPYDSFTVYGKTIQNHQQQIAKIEAKICKRTLNLQELQLLLLPKLQVLQM